MSTSQAVHGTLVARAMRPRRDLDTIEVSKTLRTPIGVTAIG